MIQTDSRDGIQVVELDAPERRNALTPEALTALREAIADSSASVVYLRGRGAAFCAGADLKTVRELDREEAVAFARQGQTVANTIDSTDAVVVAGIDGPARGGGVELALACDLRVATHDATFAESGISLGLFGAWGGTGRLPRIVGEGNALDIALSGRVIDAAEAHRIGLVSRLTEDPETVARGIADHDHRALATIKHRIRDTGPQERQDEREAVAFGDLITTAALDSSDDQ